jgi:hypothetical protein
MRRMGTVRIRDEAVCDRCSSLEVAGCVQHEVIHELYGGPATMERLTLVTRANPRAIHRALHELAARGRVKSAPEAELDDGRHRLVWSLCAKRTERGAILP